MRILFLLIALSTFKIDAALLERDWKASGDKLITLDTQTGLEWLDVTASANIGYGHVVQETGTGGDYEGFRHATDLEIEQLFVSAGAADNDLFFGSTLPEFYGPVLTIQSLLGVTEIHDLEPGESPFEVIELDNGMIEIVRVYKDLVGFAAPEPGSDPSFLSFIPMYGFKAYSDTNEGVMYSPTAFVSGSNYMTYGEKSGRGHYLVRQGTTAVPEPSSYLLVILGILGLGLYKHRKK